MRLHWTSGKGTGAWCMLSGFRFHFQCTLARQSTAGPRMCCMDEKIEAVHSYPDTDPEV